MPIQQYYKMAINNFNRTSTVFNIFLHLLILHRIRNVLCYAYLKNFYLYHNCGWSSTSAVV